MAKKLPKETQEIISKYGLTQADVWDCSNTWVILHKALEKVAAKEGITFDPPQILNSDIQTKHIAMLVVGHDKAGNSQWSIGEATPYNYKNSREDAKDRYGNPLVSYPYAIAEKRAKDRVIIKLLGLHGFYSEDEADEFKDDAKKDFGPSSLGNTLEESENPAPPQEPIKKVTNADLKKKDGPWDEFMERLDRFKSPEDLEYLSEYKSEMREKVKGWPKAAQIEVGNEFEKKQKELYSMHQAKTQLEGVAAQ